MAVTVNIGEEFEYLDDLTLELTLGKISLKEQRMILMHTGAIASFRKELIDTMGLGRTRGLMTRMGFEAGKLDAIMAAKLYPDLSDEDLVKIGPVLHTIEGAVKVTPISLDINIAKGDYSGEFLWENSFEAEMHIDTFGVHTDTTCWQQIGYACGFTSELMGRFIFYREMSCVGRGDHHCRIVGKPVEQWGDIEQELSYFRPENVADQIITLQKEVENLRYAIDDSLSLSGMIGESVSYRNTCKLLKKSADSLITVLLLGETGVGKEVFARALHSISPRANKKFVAINCAAIPEELIESELFGVEKGAYTGAQQSRIGRFERAHGGTLFLDEVGELSMSAQVKLLRVLQEGELERVGGTGTRKIDIRLVAATNVDLEQAVADGTFRADLFYRLNIYPIIIPALRDRADDIPLLVQHFIDKYSSKYGIKIAGITPQALDELTQYHWPGNIRELENMIERGVILVNPGHKIDLGELFPQFNISNNQRHNHAQTSASAEQSQDKASPVRQEPSTEHQELSSVQEFVEQVIDTSSSLDEIESLLMQTALKRSNGNLSSAARMLGLTRPQLAYRMKKNDSQQPSKK